MQNNTDINQSFVDHFYNRMLQQRFGINSCTAIKDMYVIQNHKIVDDWRSYQDITTPNMSDRIITNDCRQKRILTDAGFVANTLFNGGLNCIPDNGGGTGSPDAPIIRPIEVIVGTTEAIDYGIIEGNTMIIKNEYINRDIEIFRNNINLPSINPQDGNSYFTKSYASSIAVLSSVLIAGEIIKIKII